MHEFIAKCVEMILTELKGAITYTWPMGAWVHDEQGNFVGDRTRVGVEIDWEQTEYGLWAEDGLLKVGVLVNGPHGMIAWSVSTAFDLANPTSTPELLAPKIVKIIKEISDAA